MSELVRGVLLAAYGDIMLDRNHPAHETLVVWHRDEMSIQKTEAALWTILATPAGQALAEVVASAEALESAWDHDNLRAWTGAMRTLLSALDKLREASLDVQQAPTAPEPVDDFWVDVPPERAARADVDRWRAQGVVEPPPPPPPLERD